MALGKTITLRFENATVGELRALVAEADAAGIPDDQSLDLAWEGDGEEDFRTPVGIEVFTLLGK